ncbi:MAG: ATP-binding protein [Desulfobacterales bacterium]|nr:ATP-binding protein [Desulfobacterales bacterium]
MTRYHKLRRDFILVRLLVAVLPLAVLGGLIYRHFTDAFDTRVMGQAAALALSQRSAVEVFLEKREAILSTVARTIPYRELVDHERLTAIFEAINGQGNGLGFVDLGVIDAAGRYQAYVGPYDMQHVNHAREAWFGAAMRNSRHTSDVFRGSRELPQLIIAVRGHARGQGFILRATVAFEAFNRLVEMGRAERGGDAFIVSADGVYQTRPGSGEAVLDRAAIDLTAFDRHTIRTVRWSDAKATRFAAGAWLQDGRWLLVVVQGRGNDAGGLIRLRNIELMIVAAGILGVLLIAVGGTQLSIRRLAASDRQLAALNERLVHRNKLAALGKMAAGIAHEINNPLAVISEQAGWMRDLLAEDKSIDSGHQDEYAQCLDKIEAQVARSREVTHSMLEFVRRMAPRREKVDVGEVLQQTVTLMQHQARLQDIDIVVDLPPDLPVMSSDRSRLQQVFFNLLTNAIDAIGTVGTIRISAAPQDQKMIVQVQDNGRGVPDHLQSQLFDPFFTTKETGQGTGLGLSICHRIIDQMGGRITFESRSGIGTTFRVELPLVAT